MLMCPDIAPLSEFQDNAPALVEKIQSSGQPLFLTVEGKTAVAVLDVHAYQTLLDRIDYFETVEALKEGIDDINNGRTRPAREALAELGRKYNVSR